MWFAISNVRRVKLLCSEWFQWNAGVRCDPDILLVGSRGLNVPAVTLHLHKGETQLYRRSLFARI